MIALIDLMVEEIDMLRSKMNRIGREVKVLTHPRLIRISRQLDRKLNSYDQLVRSASLYHRRTS